jgi:phosphohistidine phosphatase
MQVLVMRHGPALDRAGWEENDAARPLSADGIDKTRLAARGLKHLGIRPQVLAASPLVRAIQTAQIVEAELGAPLEVWPELAALVEEDADLEPIVARATAQASTCVLLVGHEPGCSRLLSLLLCGDAEALAFNWKKAGVACLEDGALLWFATPKMLRGLAQASGL